MSRLIPVVVAVVAIVALTLAEGRLTQRWGDSRHGAYCATLLENIPTAIGEWASEDHEVDETVQVTAGARSYISRTYRHNGTGETVSVWLIVGHSRDTARHTPDVCYPSNGYKQETKEKHTLTLDDGSEAGFHTGDFVSSRLGSGGQKDRVYWAWFKAEADSAKPIEWVAPDKPRFAIGSTPALYKIYFTSRNAAAEVDHDKNIAMEFAREFFAVLNPILEPANGPIPEGFDPAAADNA